MSAHRAGLLRAAVITVVVTGLAGVASGWLWARLTVLPSYVMGEQGVATTTERGLTQFIAMDATYTVIGLVLGAGLGVVVWRGFGRRLGPWSVLIAIGASLAAAWLCALVGQQFGPHDFEQRLAAATPGQSIPIDLSVRSWPAWVAWPLAATLALVVITSLLPDPDEGRPWYLPWSRRPSADKNPLSD